MNENAISSIFLAEMHARLMNSIERAESLAADLNEHQLNWKPTGDQWSIAQCYEHMLVGADLYVEKLRPAIGRAKEKHYDIQTETQPRHTFAGRLILKAVEPNTKRTMSSPKIFAPTQSGISPDIVRRFIAGHKALADLIAHCDGLNFNRIKLSSPVAMIIRINAADAIEILVAHAERHLNQAERVLLSANFPD